MTEARLNPAVVALNEHRRVLRLVERYHRRRERGLFDEEESPGRAPSVEEVRSARIVSLPADLATKLIGVFGNDDEISHPSVDRCRLPIDRLRFVRTRTQEAMELGIAACDQPCTVARLWRPYRHDPIGAVPSLWHVIRLPRSGGDSRASCVARETTTPHDHDRDVGSDAAPREVADPTLHQPADVAVGVSGWRRRAARPSR